MADRYVNINYRVRRSASQQEAMKKLIGTAQARLFEDYSSIIMVSAIIGYIENKYVPIEKPASDRVLMQFFSERDFDIIDLIAYGRTKEQSIVQSDKKYEILENYANGGFPLLLDKLEIDLKEDFDTAAARKALIKYYMLLLSNGFHSNTITESDLLI